MSDKKYRLPKEFADKWIAALRSGEYKQGIGLLLNFDDNEYNNTVAIPIPDDCKFCCLGVAAIVSGIQKEIICGAEWLEGLDIPKIPKELMGHPSNNELVEILSQMNDGDSIEQKSFTEIADWITGNIELY